MAFTSIMEKISYQTAISALRVKMAKTDAQHGEREHFIVDLEKEESGENVICPETENTKPSVQLEEIQHQNHKVPGHECRRPHLSVTCVIVVLIEALLIIILLATRTCVTSSPPATSYPVSPLGPCCPEGWIGYQGKCYYFSETERNWTYSQSHCSSLNASLAVIDSQQDLVFLLRFKVTMDPWIGLRRETGQWWKWPNGSDFNKFVIRGESDCAFLSEDTVRSSRCYTERNCICSKAYAHAKGN